MRAPRLNGLLVCFILLVVVFFYNEYLIYWQILSRCDWVKNKYPEKDTYLNVMLIADTHLLGSRNGHWFDKLRREWQQHRAFQTSRSLLKPDYIIIMGDVTDEGKWCSDREWAYYENRIQELFYTNDTNTKLLVVAGNHDVGFHYDMISRKIERFNRTFKNQLVELHQPIKPNLDIQFVLINSMALENDGCKFCRETQSELIKLNKTLSCLLENDDLKCEKYKHKLEYKIDNLTFKRKYSRPILFSHFPLYRKTDEMCPNDIDSEFMTNKEYSKFKPKYDCLSLEATSQLLDLLNPRLVFNGHTHYSCFNEVYDIPEYTIASFSWRNIKTPSMLLVIISFF
jgi:predicted MPP superfamily phosphohydrolase